MKKIALVTLALILICSTNLHSQNTQADQAYIKAITTPDISQKVSLLKDYVSKYEGKGTKYENFAYATLCLTSYKGKTSKETIDYAEKALALGGLDDLTKCQVLIQLSGIFSHLGQNLEKAKNYSKQIINIAKSNKNKEATATTSAQWNKLIGAGYFALGNAQEKTKDLKGATDSYINSYNILKNKQITSNLKKIGKTLYDFKFYKEAEKAFKVSYEAQKDFVSCVYYAKSLHRNGKKNEALNYYKLAHKKQRIGEIAYCIGLILAEKSKTNPAISNEAVEYLLEASFLSRANSEKAMKIAESLFFTSNKDLKYNEKVNELKSRVKKLENYTKTFNNKFADKDEEDLSDAEKEEMKTLLVKIESEQKTIEKLQKEQEAILEKFNQLIEKSRRSLDIN